MFILHILIIFTKKCIYFFGERQNDDIIEGYVIFKLMHFYQERKKTWENPTYAAKSLNVVESSHIVRRKTYPREEETSLDGKEPLKGEKDSRAR